MTRLASGAQPLKTSVKNGNCAAQGFFGSSENQNPCKVCDKCTGQGDECKLYSHDSGCCGDKEHHHLVPVHCMMNPGQRSKPIGQREMYKDCGEYRDMAAPCLCLDADDHKAFHDSYKLKENAFKTPEGKAGKWKYQEARDAAADVAKEKVGCEPECTKAQLDAYHTKVGMNDGTDLRADSGGRGGRPAIPLSNVTNPIARP